MCGNPKVGNRTVPNRTAVFRQNRSETEPNFKNPFRTSLLSISAGKICRCDLLLTHLLHSYLTWYPPLCLIKVTKWCVLRIGGVILILLCRFLQLFRALLRCYLIPYLITSNISCFSVISLIAMLQIGGTRLFLKIIELYGPWFVLLILYNQLNINQTKPYNVHVVTA